MNLFTIIISGVTIGFVTAIPVGPVNLICIRRTLHYGWLFGFLSSLGAALGDAIFASITAFGLTAVAQLIEGNSTTLQLVGGIFLLIFGIRTFLAPPPPSFEERLNSTANDSPALPRSIASTFMLTISNPATLLSYTLIVAGVGGLAGDQPSFVTAAFIVLGVFCGSALWWLTEAMIVGLLHARINDRTVRVINEVSGILMMVFGVVVLAHLATR